MAGVPWGPAWYRMATARSVCVCGEHVWHTRGSQTSQFCKTLPSIPDETLLQCNGRQTLSTSRLEDQVKFMLSHPYLVCIYGSRWHQFHGAIFFPPDTSHLEPVILNCLLATITTVFLCHCVGVCTVMLFFKSVSSSVKEYFGVTCVGLVDCYGVLKNNNSSHVF